jgi:hypothetical protein
MQNLRVKISSWIMIMICFLLITGCTTSSYIRKAQCLPAPFPTTESLDPFEESYRRVVIDKPIQEISDYYLELLTPVDAASEEAWINGMWAIQEEPSSGKLFDCYGALDSYTNETGCIFLHMTGEEETTIEYMWILSEGAGCSPQLER